MALTLTVALLTTTVPSPPDPVSSTEALKLATAVGLLGNAVLGLQLLLTFQDPVQEPRLPVNVQFDVWPKPNEGIAPATAAARSGSLPRRTLNICHLLKVSRHTQDLLSPNAHPEENTIPPPQR
jgi:hypothetical protein